MNDGDYFYIDYLGTHPSARNQGHASTFMRYAQDVARKEGKPIYLQSSTAENRRLYESFGFVVVGERRLGVGEVGVDGRGFSGEVEGDGKETGKREGAVWWAMTWSPEDEK